MYGLANGNWCDLFCLSNSGVMKKLQHLMPKGPKELGSDRMIVDAFYGYLAYPQSIFVFCHLRYTLNDSAQVLWYASMSKV